MVNTAFALKFTTPCKQASKSVFTIFAFDLLLHFLVSYLHRVNLCKSNFSCSVIHRLLWTTVGIIDVKMSITSVTHNHVIDIRTTDETDLFSFWQLSEHI